MATAEIWQLMIWKESGLLKTLALEVRVFPWTGSLANRLIKCLSSNCLSTLN